MENIQQTVGDITVSGSCLDSWLPVAGQFAENFRTRGEVGASLAIYAGEQLVVDLWGGLANPETGATWQKDTVSIVFSCTKAATALSAQLLIDRGLLDLQEKVAHYWPEFATAGKQDITVEMMLNHSAGLPALREPVQQGGCYDWDYMCGRLAEETPFWEPGTRNGYHMLTFGWTVGELVRRVSGASLGSFFQAEIAAPLGIDFWIGLPEEMEPRVAPMIMASLATSGSPFADDISRPDSIAHLSLLNMGGFDPNSADAHRAEIGGAGGISNARGLAGMFRPIASRGEAAGRRFFSTEAVDRMGRISMATLDDATLRIATRFAEGFMKSMDNRRQKQNNRDSVILAETAFGHVGAGGSLGFADPTAGLAFGYSMNRMGEGILLNERGQSLVDAAYLCLGRSSKASGSWV